MQVTTIKFMKRKNLGNYEHEEITVEAIVDETESPEGAVVRLKNFVNESLEGNLGASPAINQVITAPTVAVEKVELKPLGNEPVATANIVKEKAAPRTRKAAPKADTNEEGQAIPPVITQEAAPSENTTAASTVVGRVDTANVTTVQSEAPKTSAPVADKKVVTYDATIKEHRSRFATYLGQNFPKWKTCQPEEAIRTFSKNLHGKPFENLKGEMLDSFKSELEVFFVNGK